MKRAGGAIKSEDLWFGRVYGVEDEPVELAMQSLELTGRVTPAGAMLNVRHAFSVTNETPIEAVYSFGLPRDAALRRFRVAAAGRSVDSRLLRRAEAEREYEEGLAKGNLSVLAKAYRDGVINLSVGQVRAGEPVIVDLEIVAGVEAHDDGYRFRFPFALAPGYHPRARSAVAPDGSGEIELPEEFGDVLLPPWLRDASGLHAVHFALTAVAAGGIADAASPSHPLRVRPTGPDRCEVSLAAERDVPNRDLVLDVRSNSPAPTVWGGVATAGRIEFCALVPSSAFGVRSDAPRRVVFVLDRSGSMEGLPIQQARRALSACLGALSPSDSFGIVAFDNSVDVLSPSLVRGDVTHREQARRFLDSVVARGGTELAQAITAAARLLGHEGGDLMVITDGQVMGTETILSTARATGIRLHCLGIGSASQDRFLNELAEQTGGQCRFLTPREAVDLPAVEMFAAISSPVAWNVQAEVPGDEDAAIEPPPAGRVYEGSPLTIFGRATPGADRRLRVGAETAAGPRVIELPLPVEASDMGEAARCFRGAKLIAGFEARMSSDEGAGRVAALQRRREESALAALSEEYGLASRAMSLVAVIRRKGDRAGTVPTTRVVPVGLPEHVSFGAYFRSVGVAHGPVSSPPVFHFMSVSERAAPVAARPRYDASDWLMDLAAKLQPDGGLPGSTDEERWIRSAIALFCFMSKGHTPRRGAFRHHVRRLLEFLSASPHVSREPRVQRLLDRAQRDDVPEADWEDLGRRLVQDESVSPSEFWAAVGEEEA